MNKKDFRMVAYEVAVRNLPRALRLMNEPKHYDAVFESRVVDVILPEHKNDNAMVLVQIHGCYPFIQAQWNEVIAT